MNIAKSNVVHLVAKRCPSVRIDEQVKNQDLSSELVRVAHRALRDGGKRVEEPSASPRTRIIHATGSREGSTLIAQDRPGASVLRDDVDGRPSLRFSSDAYHRLSRLRLTRIAFSSMRRVERGSKPLPWRARTVDVVERESAVLVICAAVHLTLRFSGLRIGDAHRIIVVVLILCVRDFLRIDHNRVLADERPR